MRSLIYIFAILAVLTARNAHSHGGSNDFHPESAQSFDTSLGTPPSNAFSPPVVRIPNPPPEEGSVSFAPPAFVPLKPATKIKTPKNLLQDVATVKQPPTGPPRTEISRKLMQEILADRKEARDERTR